MIHDEQTQQMADELARKEGDLCAVFYGKLTPKRLAGCPSVKQYNKNTLVYFSRGEDSCEDLASPKLILVQGEDAFLVKDQVSNEICRLITSRNRFEKGMELYCKYVKQAFSSRISKSKQHLARQIVMASRFHGRESNRALRMVCEYLEIADRLDKDIEVRKYPYWDDEDGGVDFYLHLC